MTDLEKILDLVKAQPSSIIRRSNRWKYPSQGDDERTSDMLEFMLKVEQTSGILIFIPTVKEIEKNEQVIG
jgi:hypothetical protein